MSPLIDPIESMIQEAVRRIVAVAAPERIILFGSAARGEMTPESDLDVLVIKSGAHRLHLTQDIYAALVGLNYSVDVIVATPEDIVRYGNSPALVFQSAMRDGRVVYESDPIPAR
jgi:predicted nucleotidyltransferase